MGSGALPVPVTPEVIGRLLDEFRAYLLAEAQAQLPRALAAKMGPSDLVQHTLVQGQLQFGSFRGKSREELAGWLRSILRNHLLNMARAYSREKRDVGREQRTDGRVVHPRQLSPSGEAMERENRAFLLEALGRLPELYRRVIELRHDENLSFSELGRRLDRTEDAARKLWTRAVQKLRHELGTDARRSSHHSGQRSE